MKNKILLVVNILLMIVLIKGSSKKTSFFNQTITLQSNNEQVTIDINDYLIGVLAYEMPASFESEALKAQAIASRTYALYFKNHNKTLTDDSKTQGYLSIEKMHDKWQDNFEKNYNKLKTAVKETENLVITQNGDLITSYYYSMSNGYTENAKTVFNEDKSYLITVVSNEDETNKNFKRDVAINKNEFCEKLNISCNLISITKIIKNDSNRVDSITINNKTLSGVEVRKLLNLRSTDFEIKENKEEIVITTKGHGHGVGMSQYGANEMAKQNATFREILNHYYPNTQIISIN